MTATGPLIELQGAWLENAGAELMLRTVVARLGDRVPGARFVVDPAFGSYAKRAELGLLQLFPRTAPGSAVVSPVAEAVRRFGGGRARAYLDSYGVVTRDEPDALVDISGFAFSDQWGPRKARQRAERATRYRRRDRPVVFMPQAWGPFDDDAVAAEVRRLIDAADLVYTRDHRSDEVVRALVGDLSRVRLAPDMTFDSPTSVAPDQPSGLVLVPNGRLVDQGGWRRDEYLDLMADVAAGLGSEFGTPTVLLHTTEAEDRELGALLTERTGGHLVADASPLGLKGRLATADVVVGSRFHALLGALSSGVPAVAVGWSHKYDELFDDFGVADLVVRRGDDATTVAERIVARAAGESGSTLRGSLADTSAEHRAELEVVWDDVAALIA